MFATLKHLIEGQNQFASGGLLLMLVGGVSVFLRQLPTHLWTWLVQQTTLTITVKDDDAAFQWVKEWLIDQNFLKRIRRVDLDTTLRGAEMALMPAPGTHFFRYNGQLFWVSFHRTEETRGRGQRRMETLTFQTVGRSQQLLRRFVQEVVACHHRKAQELSSLYMYDEYWTRVEAYSPRLIDSVILNPGEKEHMLQDVERFRASRPRYRHLGVPYHRGYLFYGPPGTGKTSLVSALAGACGMSIYAVNLTQLNDRSLKAAINEVPENSVILFEDIDAMRASTRRREAGKPGETAAPDPAKPDGLGVTLSGLLNVLDGFHAPENVIFIMTTNHADALDPALLRPGRIDYRLYLGEASELQKMALYNRFFPEASTTEAREFAQSHAAETMAEFQGLLLQREQQGERVLVESECALV